MYNAEPHSVIRDTRVTAVIERLQATRRAPMRGNPMQSGSRDPHDYAEQGFSIHPEQGELIICCAAACAPSASPSSRPRSECRRSISPPRCATMAAAP